jgi:hypothetical protein
VALVEVAFSEEKLASVVDPVTRSEVVVAWPKTVRPDEVVPPPIVVEALKTLPPEKVLLSARRVDEAAVTVLLQPKLPLDQVRALEAVLQVRSPKPFTVVPKKLVVEAVVAKRLVVVA